MLLKILFYVTVMSIITTASYATVLGIYYAPAFAVGPAANPRASLSVYGFRCELTLRDYLGFTPSLQGGFSYYDYGEDTGVHVASGWPVRRTPYTMFSGGGDYGWRWSKSVFYFGGGGTLAFAVKVLEGEENKTAPGFYVNTGWRYPISNAWFFSISPRFNFLWYKPIIWYGSDLEPARAEGYSQTLDLLIGIGYTF